MAHNRGLSQLHLSGINYSRDYPFINHFKTCDGWRPRTANTPNYVATMQASGYPASVPTGHNGWLCVFLVPPRSDYSGNWIIDWTGNGTMIVGAPFGPGAFTIVSGSGFVTTTDFNLTLQGTDGRVVFTPNNWTSYSDLTFSITATNAANPLNNIRLYRADQEAALTAGQIFNPLWLAKIKELNPGLIRFMSAWVSINSSINSKWAHRSLVSDFSYGQGRWIPSLWAGTTSGTNTYTTGTFTDIPASWVHGTMFQFQIGTTNTSSTCTINPGGLGAKTIKTMGIANPAVGQLEAGVAYTGFYDSVLDVVLFAGSSSGTNGAVGGNAPKEILVALANEIGAHCWDCAPHLADDNYFSQWASYFKSNLASGLDFYAEYSNEIWNFSFTQTVWAYQRGLAAGIPDANNQPHHYTYASRYIAMADAVAAASGSAAYKRVIAVQAAGTGSQYDTYRFKGQDLGVVAPNRPIDKCEAISPATYFQGANVREFSASYANPLTDLLTAADNYASGNPSLMSSALDYVDADVRDGFKSGVGGTATLSEFISVIWPRWHGYCVTYNVDLIEYEAALALDTLTTSQCTTLGINTAYSAKILDLIKGYKNDNRAKQITLDRYNAFIAQSKGKFPSQFTFCGRAYNPWDLIIGSLYSTPYKMYDAIVEFNAIPPLAVFKFHRFVEHLAEGVHNLGADTLKLMLSNTAPAVTNTVKADLMEITAQNGYTAGGKVITITLSEQDLGSYRLLGDDVVFTASGGPFGPFRYVVLYNDTPTSPADPLICWWDIGASITVNNTESFVASTNDSTGLIRIGW